MGGGAGHQQRGGEGELFHESLRQAGCCNSPATLRVRHVRLRDECHARAFSSEVATVRVKKTRQNKNLGLRSDSIGTEEALANHTRTG